MRKINGEDKVCLALCELRNGEVYTVTMKLEIFPGDS